MKKTSLILLAAVFGLMSLQAYGQVQTTRANRNPQRHGQVRAQEVHNFNEAKKKGKKGKKSHKFAFHHHDKDKGKVKNASMKH